MIDIWTVEDAGHDAMSAEAMRLKGALSETDSRCGLWTSAFDFTCRANADEVLRKSCDVMAIVNDVSLAKPWPTDAEWIQYLPPWFVDACAPEDAEEEDEVSLHELSPAQRRARYFTDKWKLTEWTYWMNPAERVWLWWSAEVRDSMTVHVVVDRLGDPPPGPPPGLCWLFAASGAVEYDEA